MRLLVLAASMLCFATACSSSTTNPDGTGRSELYRRAVEDDGAIDYWRLDEVSGVEAHSSLPGGLSGWFEASGVELGVAGVFGDNAAVRFSKGGNVKFGNNFGFVGTSPFSLEGWFRPSKVDGALRRLFSKQIQESTGENGFSVVNSANGGVVFRRYLNDQSDSASAMAPNGLPLFSWHHVVATYDGASMCLYVNASAPSCTASSLELSPNGTGFGVGNPVDFEGDVDELAVYNVALGGDRIRAHFELGSAP